MSHRRWAEAAGSPTALYRWICPICGSSSAGIAAADGTPGEQARFCLLQHVRATDGDGHGPANDLPEGFDPDAADAWTSAG